MQAEQHAPRREAKRRILVVDDNLDHVRSLALMFDVMGYHCDYAINATVAAEIAAAYQPDVIFLDLLLPDGHGSQICAEMRTFAQLKSTRIFGITASTRLIDHQRALDAGCDDVLRKPVAPAVFERLINGGLSRRKLRDFIAANRGKGTP